MSETLPTFASRIAYKDLRAAVEWLQKAFGFKPAFATDKDGNIVYAEMWY